MKIDFWKLIFEFLFICLSLKKLVSKNYFSIKKKFSLVSRKIFSFYFLWKTLSRSYEKKLKMLCYLLIISNLVLKLLIGIYFVLICFSILSFRIWFNLIFISILVLIFIVVICFSLIIFLIDFFYLSDLVLILLTVIYFI
jgi:hypothetical protein